MFVSITGLVFRRTEDQDILHLFLCVDEDDADTTYKVSFFKRDFCDEDGNWVIPSFIEGAIVGSIVTVEGKECRSCLTAAQGWLTARPTWYEAGEPRRAKRKVHSKKDKPTWGRLELAEVETRKSAASTDATADAAVRERRKRYRV